MRTIFTIQTNKGPKDVIGLVFNYAPGLAIHRVYHGRGGYPSEGAWFITHLQSGKYIWWFHEKTKAIQFLKQIAPLRDWTKKEPPKYGRTWARLGRQVRRMVEDVEKPKRKH